MVLFSSRHYVWEFSFKVRNQELRTYLKFVLQHFVRNLKFGETTFSGARLKELSITYKHNKDKTRLLFTSSQKFGSDVVSKKKEEETLLLKGRRLQEVASKYINPSPASRKEFGNNKNKRARTKKSLAADFKFHDLLAATEDSSSGSEGACINRLTLLTQTRKGTKYGSR